MVQRHFHLSAANQKRAFNRLASTKQNGAFGLMVGVESLRSSLLRSRESLVLGMLASHEFQLLCLPPGRSYVIPVTLPCDPRERVAQTSGELRDLSPTSLNSLRGFLYFGLVASPGNLGKRPD